jgi:hypothetical protein
VGLVGASSIMSAEEIMHRTTSMQKTKAPADVLTYINDTITQLQEEQIKEDFEYSWAHNTSSNGTEAVGCDTTAHQEGVESLRTQILALHDSVLQMTNDMEIIQNVTIAAQRDAVEGMHPKINQAESDFDSDLKKRTEQMETAKEQKAELLSAIASVQQITDALNSANISDRADGSHSEVVNFLENKAQESHGLKSKLMKLLRAPLHMVLSTPSTKFCTRCATSSRSSLTVSRRPKNRVACNGNSHNRKSARPSETCSLSWKNSSRRLAILIQRWLLSRPKSLPPISIWLTSEKG